MYAQTAKQSFEMTEVTNEDGFVVINALDYSEFEKPAEKSTNNIEIIAEKSREMARAAVNAAALSSINAIVAVAGAVGTTTIATVSITAAIVLTAAASTIKK
jgi:hypothetical protein